MSNPKIVVDTFNHIAFPPKLPGKRDSQPEKVDLDLITRLRHAVQTLHRMADDDMKAVWQWIEVMLDTCRLVNENGMVNKVALLDAFDKLHPESPVIVYIAEQNAALLFRKAQGSDDVIIEGFEASPSAEQTLAASGALQWHFPGTAISLSGEEFGSLDLQESLATFLEMASTEQIDEFAAKSRKAGVKLAESRDVVDPALIYEFLITLLGVNGCRICPPLLSKRVKDDVCWDNAELPWRRSPFWLVLRVCVQRLLYLRLGGELGRLYYKFLLCVVLALLLNDVTNTRTVAMENWGWLKAKLCRRLVKLEMAKARSPSAVRIAYLRLAHNLEPLFQQYVEKADTVIKKEWEAFKRAVQRKIPLLPLYAHARDMSLSLPGSMPYLQMALQAPRNDTNRGQDIDSAVLAERARGNTTEQFASLSIQYSSLVDLELRLRSGSREIPTSNLKSQKLCIDIAQRINQYINVAGNAYTGDQEHLSEFIMNIFELWVYMDKCALVAYPLLQEYHPGFHPELLDVLHLSSLTDLERLQEIQNYIHKRCTGASEKEMTIFTDPSPECFADRYLRTSMGKDLVHLQDQIEAASVASRHRKEAELAEVNREFQSLSEKIARTSCTQRRNPDGTHDIRGCNHCYHIRCRRRLQISVHEDYLPADNRIAEKRAIVFELAIPEAFAVYRSATWSIINRLGPQVDLPTAEEPRVVLEDYKQLANYKRPIPYQGRFALASYTKSYLGTHYKWRKLPAAKKNVLLPQGLSFRYYDAEKRLWSKDRAPLTLAHHFSLSLPPSHPLAGLYSSSSFAPDGPGPSSYEAISKVRECPPTITAHEFMAHQALMAGKHSRWVSILIELGSSNLNLSSLETMILLRHLTLQAGPRALSDTLRISRSVFREAEFCKKLIEQIHQHLSIIAPNWRETIYMETMLTLTLQLCNLGCHETSAEAKSLLYRVRNITLQWINHLRNETRNASEVDVAERAARYCFLAALLCRRTFSLHSDTHVPLDMESAQCFIEATLALQESLVVDITKFSTLTRSMLVRDIRMSARLRQVVQNTIRIHPSSINCVLDKVWPNRSGRVYTTWEHLQHPYECWVTAKAKGTEQTLPQVFHFHLLEGHLLVDGKALGKLPADIRDSETLKELFGNQRLIAFPSNMPGMNYTLALDREGHQIHLGYRNKNLVIRAWKDGRTFELIPRSVFERNGKLDLPVPLVFDCVHWVNLNSGILEARRMPLIWRERPGNWKINIRTRQAQRGKSLLVDPYSQLAISIAEIFHHFEHPSMLTIYQPSLNTLSLELKRMNLGFHVNKRQLLQCKQLAAEVDPNQDAGTLYGLQSMLVLRNAYNRSQRSIITPLGKLEYERHGIHVLVRKGNNGDYGRYMIDDVLGRLHGPVEPLLLFTLAQLHAFTSFSIPDPLTGRTGTEEALSYLRSGYSQPWTPLVQGSIDLLQNISRLSPHREYYPPGVKRQQLVKWDPNLTVSIQHEAYQPVIQSILDKSQRLSLFQVQATPPLIDTSKSEVHLQERACWRRCLYERTYTSCENTIELPDVIYTSRFRYCSSKQASRVREIVTLLRERPSKIYTTHRLSSILHKWSYIGGYTDVFRSYSLEGTLFVDFAAEWGKLVRLCVESDVQNFHSLMFCLGLMAYGEGIDFDMIRVLAAFSILDGLKQLSLPLYSSFENFRDQECPDFDSVLALVQPFCVQYKDPTPQKKKAKQVLKAAEVARIQLAKENHNKKCTQESNDFVSFILQQWPCAEPSEGKFTASFLNVVGAVEAVSHDWLRRYKNMRLAAHINDVQKVLNAHSAKANKLGDPPATSQPTVIGSQCSSSRNVVLKLGQDLISKSGAKLESNPGFSSRHDEQGVLHSAGYQLNALGRTPLSKWKAGWAPEINELEGIVHRIADSDCTVRSNYGQDLQLSIAALKDKRPGSETSYQPEIPYHEGMARCDADIRKARAIVDRYHHQICDTFTVGDPAFIWLQNGNLWPCVTPVTILQQLRSTSGANFGPNMKGALLSYAVAIVRLQRFIRIKELFAKRDKSRLDQERYQPSHSIWDYVEFPDWLLLEIDSNMQIRQEQVTVALEMVSPASGCNTALQMNMGQGKTSVIMPMVAAALADGHILPRVLVPKALTTQTAQILQARLGGLVGRSLVYIPFSRRTPTTPNVIGEYRTLQENILRESGIVLGNPEHTLSFKLSGRQLLSDLKVPQAVEMVETQDWIDRVAHDILDECDFTLAVKTQLIYPGGSQLAVDGHPDRWEVIMAVLELVAQHLSDLARELPYSIDIIERAASTFPIAHLLREDAETALIERVVKDVCSGRSTILPIQDCKDFELEAIRQFIYRPYVDRAIVECVNGLFQDMPKVRKRIYLLRGILVHRILLLCLKKRWNVQYGLHPSRDPMAVPFHAKGVPSDHAEWGHPDVAILFTCLAFYYEGLTQEQCRRSLQAILKTDDPATAYDRLTQGSGATLPETLRHWNLINIDDHGQIAEIWYHLRFSITAINYFLKTLVFPIHAKQFSIKLQSSGWDVPFFSNSSSLCQERQTKRSGLTTGFSGTNDNRRLLPLTIQQRDLPELLHTNAEVLTYLLHKRNRGYRYAAVDGRRFTEAELLMNLMRSGIRILIDAGAYILEMDNRTLVRTWLDQDTEAQAAVYFGRDNQAWVQYRTGKTVPLFATPFADNLKDCLVYLDESHTRGTDLKLPADARGALTLGLNQTKDHTVQAAMRLRQLGQTQSVIFIAPPEVHQSILDVCKNGRNETIDSSHVVYWLLFQTCANNRELQPLFYAQGAEFCRRIQAAAKYPKFLSDPLHREAYVGVLQQPEQQTLEQLYKPQIPDIDLEEPTTGASSFSFSGRVAEFMQVLRQQHEESKLFQNSIVSSALEEVEQEREVAYEIEEEREIQRPRRLEAHQFPGLHPSLSRFAKTGILERSSFVSAADVLFTTNLGLKYSREVTALLPRLCVSTEFTKTVKLRPGARRDEFMRPVTWLLCNIATEAVIVVTPEEAEELIPILRTTPAPSMHLITYAAPVTKRMLHFSHLDYYAIPSFPTQFAIPYWLSVEIGIFAGRLYFAYTDYACLLQQMQPGPEEQNSNGTLTTRQTAQMSFLEEWLVLRRRNQDISHTPMGYLCQNRALSVDHPFFVTAQVQNTEPIFPSSGYTGGRKEEEEYYDSEEEEVGVLEPEEGDQFE
ncbi:hypothetical protein BDV38DRAFT_120045 [Aspergillus pseudotamarii]|uniref:ubiquitinyl hydrolase 1 n=1 Tax=Aspergillus pseudotamarii TaxID=132259 RepID=A0A5N6SQ49_ASPPS|nr:uncharacterized protein BDV38DRAFT_120045 [Aspergillus pseudotamarii]KAE8135900.1 hypothetical protein BDV38DRAFT_120045 [Aspergillus pseudotamarii]